MQRRVALPRRDRLAYRPARCATGRGPRARRPRRYAPRVRPGPAPDIRRIGRTARPEANRDRTDTRSPSAAPADCARARPDAGSADGQAWGERGKGGPACQPFPMTGIWQGAAVILLSWQRLLGIARFARGPCSLLTPRPPCVDRKVTFGVSASEGVRGRSHPRASHGAPAHCSHLGLLAWIARSPLACRPPKVFAGVRIPVLRTGPLLTAHTFPFHGTTIRSTCRISRSNRYATAPMTTMPMITISVRRKLDALSTIWPSP